MVACAASMAARVAAPVVTEGLALTADLALAAELQYWRGYFELERNAQRAHDVLRDEASSIAGHDPAYAARMASEAATYAIVYFDPERALRGDGACALVRSSRRGRSRRLHSLRVRSR